MSLAGLYATRLVLGAARGMLWPVAFAEVAEAGPLDQRAGQFSIFWLYFGIGQLLGPLIGGLLGEKLSLTAPFFAAALASLLLLPAAGIIRSVRDDSPNPLRSYATLLARAPTVGRIWLVTMLNTVAFSIMTTFLKSRPRSYGLMLLHDKVSISFPSRDKQNNLYIPGTATVSQGVTSTGVQGQMCIPELFQNIPQ